MAGSSPGRPVITTHTALGQVSRVTGLFLFCQVTAEQKIRIFLLCPCHISTTSSSSSLASATSAVDSASEALPLSCV